MSPPILKWVSFVFAAMTGLVPVGRDLECRIIQVRRFGITDRPTFATSSFSRYPLPLFDYYYFSPNVIAKVRCGCKPHRRESRTKHPP